MGFEIVYIMCTREKGLELSTLISAVLSNSHRVRAKTLAKISGKIIAMTPALGFITQIMTLNGFIKTKS